MFRRTLTLLAALSLPIVAAEPVVEPPAYSALGDSAEPRTGKRAREMLEQGRFAFIDHEGHDLQPAAAAAQPAMSPELVAQLKPMYEKSIKGLKDQIEKLDAANDSETITALRDAVKRTEESLAAMTSGKPLPAAAPDPNALKIPRVGDRSLTMPEALASLSKFLKDNESAEALAAFASSPHAKSADAAASFAAGATLADRPLAAVAALLRAHELDPKRPLPLINLAALCDRVGLPRHALALLAGAESLGNLTPPQRVLLLTNKGHALTLLNKPADAEPPLREAVRLAPASAAARANLAHALYRQDDEKKKAEAVSLIAFARAVVTRPQPDPAKPDAPPPAPPEDRVTTSPPTREKPTDEEVMQDLVARRNNRPHAAAVFDLSRGKAGTLPTIKIPRTIGEAAVMAPKVDALHKELMAESRGVYKRMRELEEIMRSRERSGTIHPASADRARDVFWYVTHSESEPPFRAMFLSKRKAAMDPGNGSFGGQTGNPYASLDLMKEQDVILARAQRFEVTCEQMWQAAEPYHGKWQAPIRNLYNECGLYFQKEYAYMTALAANLADPVHNEYANCLARVMAISRFQEFLGVLKPVTNWAKHYASSWRVPLPGDFKFEYTKGEYPPADPCHAMAMGETMGGVTLKRKCETVTIERDADADLIKGFKDLTDDIDFYLTVVEPGDSPLPGPPKGTGYSGVDENGFAAAVDAKGRIMDFASGPKATTKSFGITASFPH